MVSAAAPVLANAPSRSPYPVPRPALASRLAVVPLLQTPSMPLSAGSMDSLLARSGVDRRDGADRARRRNRGGDRTASRRFADAARLDRQGGDGDVCVADAGVRAPLCHPCRGAGGEIAGGTLTGDLIRAAVAIRRCRPPIWRGWPTNSVQRGLREVAGRFIVDDSALPGIPHIDSGQPAAAGYNPALAGINLNFNRVYFGWRCRLVAPV